ncbi:MAG: hypothetical protein KGZ30_03365 [Anaplasmataceae bacterium]|nr:hypothetical protein [Anaplasmataceae bacterium]
MKTRGSKVNNKTTYTKVAMWLSDLYSSRNWCFSVILFTCLAAISQMQATIFLDDAMSEAMQKKTGVDSLSYQQKLALEQWLNDNFVQKKTDGPKKDNSSIYLSQNIDGGRRLQLSDGSIWDVAPQDVVKANFWVLPFPLHFTDNEDPLDKADYPKIIVNDSTGVGVKVRVVTPPSVDMSVPQS